MKKNWLKILCMVLTVVMAMSLASCSFLGGSKIASNDSAEAKAVATYVRENGKTIEDAANAQLGSPISVKLEARGAALVYKYTLIGIDNVTAQQKNAISDNLDTLVTDSMLDSIRKEVPAADAIVYEYYEADGDLVLSKRVPL